MTLAQQTGSKSKKKNKKIDPQRLVHVWLCRLPSHVNIYTSPSDKSLTVEQTTLIASACVSLRAVSKLSRFFKFLIEIMSGILIHQFSVFLIDRVYMSNTVGPIRLDWNDKFIERYIFYTY